MATKAAEAQAHPPAAPVERPVRAAGGRGKLIMIAVLALLLLGAAGGAAWYFMHSSDDEDVPVAKGKKAKDKDGKDIKDAKETAGPRKPSEFMNLDTFIVNLQDEAGTHYLQTAIVFEVADEKAVASIKAEMPVIRSKILLLLSSKLPSELKTPEGKEKLADEIATEARKYLNVKSPEEALTQVHFGSFVIQ